MKISAFFLLIILSSCTTTKVYLVRHAEKAGNAPTDGLKIPEGVARRDALGLYLNHYQFAGVYSTNYPRTIQTIKPLADLQGIPLVIYNNGDSLLSVLIAEKNRRFVIVGHSNTIPQMIRANGLNPGFSGNIPDNEFDNLYIITVKQKNGSPVKKSQKKKYGAATP